MNVLVDTSIWFLALRRRSVNLNSRERLLVEELSDLVKDGRAHIIGLIRQELLSGIQSGAQFDKLQRTLSAFRDEPVDAGDHEAAAKASNDCRARGVAVSVVDILICAVAQRRRMAVFAADQDFEMYAGVLTLQLHSLRNGRK
jgi:predicted nucleic acid-binding protein